MCKNRKCNSPWDLCRGSRSAPGYSQGSGGAHADVERDRSSLSCRSENKTEMFK